MLRHRRLLTLTSQTSEVCSTQLVYCYSPAWLLRLSQQANWADALLLHKDIMFMILVIDINNKFIDSWTDVSVNKENMMRHTADAST